ncbi:regulator [Vibrio kasasachensis]
MNHRNMTNNFIFRELECGLNVVETANLCFKTRKTIEAWDRGKEIPPECKRLMRLSQNRELSVSDDWKGFRMSKDQLEIPTGQLVLPQQIVTGIALLDIQSELEIVTTSKLLKYARILAPHFNC